MFLETIKTATVPARRGSGRNDSHLHIWRLKAKTQDLRVVSHMGEFSVWQEHPRERELFRINLGILAEIARRATLAIRREQRSRKPRHGERPELSEAETRLIPALTSSVGFDNVRP